MNHVASPAAPSERIRGAASEPDTSHPQYLHPDGDAGGMESGRVQTKRRAGDDDKRSRRARLDRTSGLSILTTVEGRFKRRRGTRRSTGPSADRASSLLPRRARGQPSDRRSPPWRFAGYEPWSKPATTNEPNESGPKDDALP